MCLALFASSALAAPAPQTTKGDPKGTSALVDKILGQLDGSINAAIQAALGAPTVEKQQPILTNFQGTFSQVNKPSKNKVILWNQRIIFLCCRAPPLLCQPPALWPAPTTRPHSPAPPPPSSQAPPAQAPAQESGAPGLQWGQQARQSQGEHHGHYLSNTEHFSMDTFLLV